MRNIDLTGQKIGRLTVLRCIGSNANNKKEWDCLCECGNHVSVITGHLTSGHTQSCGCLAKEKGIAASKESNTRHGMRQTQEYRAWAAMKARCNNPNDAHYPNYGGRRIKICERWENSFENFYEDMGEAPKGTSIDRIDNNGNYEPTNCQWATVKQQARNKRNTIYITYKGEVKPLVKWAEELSINADTLFSRIFKSHWSVEKALTTPAKRRK